jgi:hypothetical protein
MHSTLKNRFPTTVLTTASIREDLFETKTIVEQTILGLYETDFSKLWFSYRQHVLHSKRIEKFKIARSYDKIIASFMCRNPIPNRRITKEPAVCKAVIIK